jgi:hypothetical protein
MSLSLMVPPTYRRHGGCGRECWWVLVVLVVLLVLLVLLGGWAHVGGGGGLHAEGHGARGADGEDEVIAVVGRRRAARPRVARRELDVPVVVQIAERGERLPDGTGVSELQ